MSTENQINANRLNAQKSTGPRIPEGKAKVAQNAVTHGLTAQRPVLSNEDPEAYTQFRDDFRQNHCLEKVQKYEMTIERSFFRTLKELRQIQSLRLGQIEGKQGLVRSAVKQVVPVPAFPAQNKQNSATTENKPKIPPFDPIKLLENCIANPIGLDPLTKIKMKKDHFQRLAKKAM